MGEDSDNLVIRMYNVQGIDTQVKLNSYFTTDNLQQTNIIEENPQPVSTMNVSKYGIETFSFDVNLK